MSNDFRSQSAHTRLEQSTRRHAIDRRRLMALTAGLGVTAAVAGAGLGAPWSALANRQDHSATATGHTWLLDAPDALRPSAPGAATDTELDELLAFQADRTDEMVETINRWGGRLAVLPWLDLGMELTALNFPPGPMELRAQSLLRTAMNDAVVATLDAQAAHARPAPAIADDRIEAIGVGATAESSFPSVHAAVAGAASTVLAFLFPDASEDRFAGLADEAATSRLWSGSSYRSDVEAGLTIGRAVGDLAVTRGQSDNSNAVWDSSDQPTGDGYWAPTPPNFDDPALPLAGSWATWVLPSGDSIRPAPFPAYGSPAWLAELTMVRRITARRTLAQERIIDYWRSKGPNGFYTAYAADMAERESLDEAEAASVLAMTSVAMYDALVAVYDAKYHYWTARPITIDPDLDVYFPTPPYPAYPGGFGAVCGAGATVLADAFPANEVELLSSASEAAAQRGWAGIHYVLDDDVALMMGCQVGRMTVAAVHGGAGALDG